MSPPEDLDRLSQAELKGLVVSWEQIVELQRWAFRYTDSAARPAYCGPDHTDALLRLVSE